MNNNNDQSIPNFPIAPSIDEMSGLLGEGAFELLTQLIKTQNDCNKAIEEYKKFREERKKNDGQTNDLHKTYIRDNDIVNLLNILEKHSVLIAENQRLLIAMITVQHADSDKQGKSMDEIMRVVLKPPDNLGTNIGSINSGTSTEITGKNKK